jgi:hypothetical protein
VQSSTLSPFLFDRRYWSARLTQLEQVGPRVFVRRRPTGDGARSCVEELRLRALDGACLRALLVRPEGRLAQGLTVVVDDRPAGAASEPDAPLDWPGLAEEARRAASGRALLLVPNDERRRLEDRVLDLLCTVRGARQSAALPRTTVEFESRGADDTVAIARTVMEKRWS